MPNFCSNCATALEFDSRFCPSCSTPVRVTSALAVELRENVQSGVSSIVHSSSLKVPKPIWAGVIEVMWTFMSVGGLLFGGIGAIAGAAEPVERRAYSACRERWENVVVWLLFALLLNVVQLSFNLPLIYGFFAQKRWAYGLYLWSVIPLVLAGVILTDRIAFLAGIGSGDSNVTEQYSDTWLDPGNRYPNLANSSRAS